MHTNIYADRAPVGTFIKGSAHLTAHQMMFIGLYQTSVWRVSWY